ncbi:SNF2 family N-terminal domain-domain-containing protein [Naematelia encephala]|uniref:SNF2 family N-terminal domain-domain-containing protein n=1 Tax=Naematelia encephala TaxID=71784 RepID=A0A1Y2B4N1_9TREE|nr:SNF2 family N-terminal domain-domain-containing protein [Naematelia encephala]
MSTDAERKRRDALAALKMRRNGNAPARPGPSSTNLSSPDSHVLVPSSSSPAGPSHTSKIPSHGQVKTYSSGVIPSSNLGAPRQAFGNPLGTPSAVMHAIQNRKTAQDEKRPAGQSSLSYEPSRGLSESPSSPQSTSRITTHRYPDDPLSSPTSSRPVSRTPSLISAVKQQYDAPNEKLILRLANQFRNVNKVTIADAVRRFPNDLDRAINEVEYINNQRSDSNPNSPIQVFSPPVPRVVPKVVHPPPYHIVHPPPGNATPIVHPATIVRSSPLVQPPPVIKTPKSKKNEKSMIYKNRESDGKKRRDPDESSEGGEATDGESEMDWSGDEGPRRKKRKGEEDQIDAEGEALKAFNEVDADMLTGTIACSVEQAQKIISLRPYDDVEAVQAKLQKARGVSFKLFEQYTEIMEGYVQIDACLNRCEAIAKDVANTLAVWRGASEISDSTIGTPRSDGLNDVKVDVAKVTELLRKETNMRKKKILASYIQTQPASLSEGTVLKDYQLLGVNWLNLLYSKKIGCILADEMGLGKTIQVIAFLASLKERGNKGPHMIFVPASTLENWLREFDRFAPDIDVQSYYGTQGERASLRDDLKRRFRSGKLEVVLASYTQVASSDDLGFFRKKIVFETCIYDEGHRLKNCTTKAYTDLLSIKPKWRLLLTGTPMQNNLQELVSLLMFIHKDVFTDAEPYLRAIFKSQGHANLLSAQRVSRARTMLTPFVLRRRKAHVLDLPPKIETTEHCDMTPVQAKLYRETLQRSRKVLEELDDEALDAAAVDDEKETTKKPSTNGKKKKVEEKKGRAGDSAHILMDLRKAASHPLLFRRLYTDAKVKQIARACLNTPKWCDSNFDYVVEDLEIMSDAEIHHFCEEAEYDEINKFALDHKAFLEGGKVRALERHVKRCQKEGKRILLFSQFVMILDILQVALDHLGVKYTRLDGQTKTDERQGLVDEFNEDPDITIFLLSTKAGGVGINLTAASVVIIYDQDFNPHNDRQAADRAYRIGQEKEVEVIKLITKGSIDEDMLSIGQTKLQLDDAVGGEEVTLDGGDIGAGAGKEDKTAKEMRKSLLTTLRNKFEVDHGANGVKHEPLEGVKEDVEPDTPRLKKARGSVVAQDIAAASQEA